MSHTEKFILTLDQGTTSSRALLLDKHLNVAATAQQEITQYYPRPGWVEHDALEIWSTIHNAIHAVLDKANAHASSVVALGITNQRETVVLWDRETGQPIAPAIVWQCRRTTELCQTLSRQDGVAQRIQHDTGLVLDPYFSASKISWLLDNVPKARDKAYKGQLCMGTIDSWLIWNLTGGQVHATDMTNACRTMLFNIHTKQWDPQLLAIFDIPRDILPEVKHSSELYGYTDLKMGKGDKIPITGVAGDQQAALFGQCCIQPGMVKNTYGTGCFLLMNTGEKAHISQHGLLTTLVLDEYGKAVYGLEGGVFSGGATIQWLRDELEIVENTQQTQSMAQQVADTQGVYFVPAFVGLGAPYWDPKARGIIVGLTRGSNRCHIVRAALESIAYQSADVLRAMLKDTQMDLKHLYVDGGATRNDFLMQFQADILNVDVIRANNVETSALGAVFLAGLSVGFWTDMTEITQLLSERNECFVAKMAAERRKKLYQGWVKAVERARDWQDD